MGIGAVPKKKKTGRKGCVRPDPGALLSLAASTETQHEQPIDWPDEGPGKHKTFANLSAEDLVRYTVRAVKRGLYHDLYDVNGEPVLVVAKERATIWNMKHNAHYVPNDVQFTGLH